MGLFPKSRGAAWPRGAWGHSRRRAASGGRDGAALASFAALNWKIGLGAWREMTGEGGPRARRMRRGQASEESRNGIPHRSFHRAQLELKTYPSASADASATTSSPAPPSTTGLAKRSSFRFCASSLLCFR